MTRIEFSSLQKELHKAEMDLFERGEAILIDQVRGSSCVAVEVIAFNTAQNRLPVN